VGGGSLLQYFEGFGDLGDKLVLAEGFVEVIDTRLL
jgi:hypothetical protein